MNSNWILLPLAPLALALPGQQPAAPRKLERIPAAQSRPLQSAPDGSKQSQTSAQEWRKRLSDSDLDRREASYSELVESARNDADARGVLEELARSNDAGELAWTARLALRELRNSNQGGTRGLRQRFDALEQRFGGIDSSFEDMRARMEQLMREMPQGQDPAQPFGGQPGTTERQQSYSLEVGPDGVKLKTNESADGNGETQTYEAKDMDELLREHPELRERIGNGGGFDLHGAPGQNWFFLRDGQPQNDWLRSPRPSQQPPTDVLGIYSHRLAPEESKDLALAPEQGLRVDRVEPGTIAQILGIRRGDTIVELNGSPVYGSDDVRKALKERRPEEDVSVTLIGAGTSERRTLRWSPGELQPPARPLMPSPKPAPAPLPPQPSEKPRKP
jgi:hypothetical protein